MHESSSQPATKTLGRALSFPSQPKRIDGPHFAGAEARL
ncbi:hypothetical protein PAMC26577_35275 [Caballeronia sordidicola]|uniref:Uncharacterized protein n=1 Tax=Caballeronia sordidicola TaxID=196367 RepID=A0A2C9XUX2_CABSO|nr:hypothetical protein PAMC26577_35275 [Caballeronia sordidicola]